MDQQDTEQVFKGMRRFKYVRPDVLLDDAKQSPYFWWWAYLRLSKDYWWVCQLKGKADDPRLRSMYRDFGDVFAMPFEDWWRKQGNDLFAERIAPPEVRELDRINMRLSPGMSSHLLLEIPLNLTEATIIKQVKKMLRNHPSREVERRSSARRPLAKFTGIRKDLLQIAHVTWQMHWQSRDLSQTYKIGQVQGSKSLYQIGKELRLVRTCMPVVTDNAERAAKRVNGMKVAVSRMLARANYLAQNAAVGTFPSVQPMTQPIVWRSAQQQRMEEAVAAEEWRPLFGSDEIINHLEKQDQKLIDANVPLLDDDLLI
ncbi:hypothetical protein ACHEXK_05960 [Limnohabitans sp. DCL3]|uniref:hypothetical protein n=1 Tax=Limnohabitans sp. DCL3 TaxID=3374103 RepID=UPI003A86D102